MPKKVPCRSFSDKNYREATTQIKIALGIDSNSHRTTMSTWGSTLMEDQSRTIPAWCTTPNNINFDTLPHPPTDPVQFAADPFAYPHFGFLYFAPSAPGEPPHTFIQPIQPVLTPQAIQSFPLSCMPHGDFVFHHSMLSQHAVPSYRNHGLYPFYHPTPQHPHTEYQPMQQQPKRKELPLRNKCVIPIINPITGAQINVNTASTKMNIVVKDSALPAINSEPVKKERTGEKDLAFTRKTVEQELMSEPVDAKYDGPFSKKSTVKEEVAATQGEKPVVVDAKVESAAKDDGSTSEEELTDEDYATAEAESVTSVEESANEEEQAKDESSTEEDGVENSSSASSSEIEAKSADKEKGCTIQPKRIQYTKEFLLQFRERCKEATANLSLCTIHAESARNAEHGRSTVQQSGNNQCPVDLSTSTSSTLRDYHQQQIYLGPQRWYRSDRRVRPTEQPIPEQPTDRHQTEQQPVQPHPLKRSKNCWLPSKYRESKTEQPISDEQLQQKIKALLNKLSAKNFDSISTQIFEHAKDARSLKIVVHMTFEKACDEPCFSNLWAKLCRKMYDGVNSDKFVDPAVLDQNGHPTKGVLLFRKYLVTRCQETYERGWSSATYEMLTEEYYQAAKAKRQALGLITFIGELFKQNILSLKIVQTCLQGMISTPENVGDDVVETICKLLETAGMVMDVQPHSKTWLDAYMQRVESAMDMCQELSARVKFKVMDLNDLRKRKWITKRNI